MKNYKAHIDYIWVDERDHYSKGKDPESKKIIKGPLDDYQIVDIKVGRSMLQNSLEIYLGARNLFDEDYEESYSLVMPGRRVYGGVEYSF